MKKGFTLVELLVAISIIAILTAILLPNFMGARERARDAQRIQDLNAVKNGLRMYYNDNQTYPATGADLPTILEEYIPSMEGIGYTYVQTLTGDGFQLCVTLDSTSNDSEAQTSQKKCQVSSQVCGRAIDVAGNTFIDRMFVVCGS